MQSLDFTSKIIILSPSSASPQEASSSSIEIPEANFQTACGFRFWTIARRSISATDDSLEIYLQSEPESFCADSYQLLIDYHLMLMDGDNNGDQLHDMTKQCAGISVKFEPVKKGYSEPSADERWTLRVRWDEACARRWAIPAEDNGETRTNCKYWCSVRCQVKVRELLTLHREDYSEESLPRRDFELLLSQQKQLYVDLNYLADLGSEYFQDLLESKRKGVRRAVVMNVDAADVEIFLDAMCTHRKLIITNRNFDTVLRMAQEFCVDKALRACEAYLIETDAVHPIRKLEYAAECGLGLLGERVARQLTDSRPLAALDSLHEYLQLNDERLDQMHPDVLSALNVYPYHLGHAPTKLNARIVCYEAVITDFTFMLRGRIGQKFHAIGSIDPFLCNNITNDLSLAFLRKHLGIPGNVDLGQVLRHYGDWIITGTNVDLDEPQSSL